MLKGACKEKCVEESLYREVCSREFIQGSVLKGAYTGKCVQGSLYREVC